MQPDTGETTTVFDLMLQPNEAKNYYVPNRDELEDEAFLFLLAGTDSTAYTLQCATYYILSHEEVLRRLRTEIDAVPSSCDELQMWKIMAGLPYLVSSRLSRSSQGALLTGASITDCRDQRVFAMLYCYRG